MLTAVWLRQKRALTYTLAGGPLSFFSLLALAIVAMMVFMSPYTQPVASFMAAVFGILLAISLPMTVRYPSGLKNNG
jgi:hypothetical protein